MPCPVAGDFWGVEPTGYCVLRQKSTCITQAGSQGLPRGYGCDPHHGAVPVSNSKPFSVKVWQQPPSFPCCSSTSTRLPALASSAAAPRPPMPLPITMASSRSGTLSAEKTEGAQDTHTHGGHLQWWKRHPSRACAGYPEVTPESVLGGDGTAVGNAQLCWGVMLVQGVMLCWEVGGEDATKG